MIKHCVFVKFRESVNQSKRSRLYEKLNALEPQIDGWCGFVAGLNSMIEPDMDKGYNGGFIIDFKDAAARDRYIENEDHRRLGAELVAATEGGLEGIMVFDFTV